MWFGTYDGLNRYDGYQFKIFRNVIGDTNSLSFNNLSAIEGDANHNIWIGGQNGVSIFNPVTSTFFTPVYSQQNNAGLQKVRDNVHVIKALEFGYILIGTYHQGLLVFEHSSNRGIQISFNSLKSEKFDYNVSAIEFEDQRKTVWVFIQKIGLCEYDLQKRQLKLVSNFISQANYLKCDKKGSLWLATDKGVFQFNTTTHLFSNNYLPQGVKAVNLCLDKNNELWIATDGNGVWLLSSAGMAKPLLSPEGLPLVNSNAVYAIYEDLEGRKWIGTLRGGINLLESRVSSFKLITYKTGGPNNIVNNFILSFCEDINNNVWIGTDGAGLRYWNRHKNTFTEYLNNPSDKNSISSNFITSIVRDFKNEIWISTWFGGINHFNRVTHTFDHFICFNPKTNQAENNVWQVYEDAQNRLWASATNDGSLYLFNREAKRFELFDDRIINIQYLTEDREGNFWGGNYSSLIKIDREHKQHTTYNIGYTIRCIYEDKEKNFWIGTQEGGLLLFNRKNGKYKRFTTSDGLPGNTILRLLEDGKGNLWMSTYNGLSKFNPRNGTFRNFSQSDGLQSNQFSFNAGIALKSGEFLFGGIKGFNIFYPDSVHEQINNQNVFLTGIKINNRAVEQDTSYITKRILDNIKQITLPYDHAILSLDFTVLEFTDADKINYAYLLKGWDKGWNYTNGSRTANYSRLQEGKYTFKVKVRNADGKWSKETELLQIIVLPPWYRTWWAYLIYVVCFIGSIYVYIKYTKQRERLRYEIKLSHLENEKDKELTEKKLSFFTHISHEFRTPLSLIINPVKELLAQEGKADEKSLNTVYRNARRLLSLVDQLLLFRKAESGEDILKVSKINITELSNEVYKCFLQQAKTANINYQFSVDKNNIDIFGDYEKIEIALFNLLSNAFKFTPNSGAIEVNIKETNEEVIISVMDNGCGIEKSETMRIFEKFQQETPHLKQKTGFGIGLYLVKHFIENHKGKVICNSVLGEGTAFSITLKKGIAHLSDKYVIHQTQYKHELLDELSVENFVKENGLPPVNNIGKTAEEVITGKKSILVIDDNEEIRLYLKHIFIDKYLVYIAENGADGYRLANQNIPDLIISDINMQGMDGVELCSKIKKSEILGHIPVILLTASTADEVKLRGIEEGADDYIIKPFDNSLLLAKIETILKNRNLLQRYFLDNITLKETSIKVPPEYQEFLQNCIEVIEQNIDTDDFNIKKFSKAMGMSHSALYKKVKLISGQSLTAFIRSIRLRRAAVILLSGNISISQAAFQVGIADVKYFREHFVKIFGMTPSSYIKKYRDSFHKKSNVIRI